MDCAGPALRVSRSNCTVLLVVPTTNNLLLAAKKHPEKIVCSNYNDVAGVPCIMPRKHFPALINLKGDSGAKAIIETNLDQCLFIDMPNAGKDIDRVEDLIQHASDAHIE